MDNETFAVVSAVVAIGTPVLSLISAVIGNYLAAQIRAVKTEAEMKAMRDTIERQSERIAALEDLIHSLLLQGQKAGA